MVLQDNDAIDLTDNDIAQLANFPLQPRLRTLFLAQNRIANIQPNLSSSIPNLQTLVLTKNRITELADLDPLAGFKRLVFLVVMGNPMAAKEVRTFAHMRRTQSTDDADAALELPLLGDMAVPERALSGLCQSEGCRA